jgi:hypothetical protein
MPAELAGVPSDSAEKEPAGVRLQSKPAGMIAAIPERRHLHIPFQEQLIKI